jgi:hypothetical protein
MDYGEAHFIRTKSLKQQLLVFKSERKLGFSYKFMKNTENQYRCFGCYKFKKMRSVTVIDGRIVGKKHPEDDHDERCEPFPQSAIDSLDIDRDMRHSVRETGKRPRDAFSDAVSSISKKFKTSEEQEAVVVNFPSYPEVRRQLTRHRTAQHIAVPNPQNIPDELRKTLRGLCFMLLMAQ